MSIQIHFNTFNKKIYLTNRSEAYKKAKQKDQSILDAIKAKFVEEEYPVQESFLQGSFAVDTAIVNVEGDHDIDRAVAIKEEDAPTDPVKTKKTVLAVLENRGFKNANVKIPCITADYLSLNLHIDYTVYLKDGAGDYKLAVGKVGSSEENKKWAESDPRGLLEWISGSDDYGLSSAVKRLQYKRLVRYLKRWRDVTFSDAVKEKIFSIGLTVMIKHEYRPDYFETEVEDDLTALKKVVDNILSLSANYFILASSSPVQYRVSVRLPRSPYTSIFRHKDGAGVWTDGSAKNTGTQLRNQLVSLQEKLSKALDETDVIKQCKILNGVFGDDFEIPDQPSSNNSNSPVGKTASAAFPTAGVVGTSQGASAV
ncbi:MAG: nucleotidyltransferase [Desulfobacter sp.]